MFLLLMILPQNKIYNMLKARLNATLHSKKKPSKGIKQFQIDEKEAFQIFNQIAMGL